MTIRLVGNVIKKNNSISMENVDTILVKFKDGTSEIYSKKSMKRFRKKFFPESLEKNISQISQISQPALVVFLSYQPSSHGSL